MTWRGCSTSAAELFVRGVPVRWNLPATRRVDLPTYAFQHKRFWQTGVPDSAGDPAGLGLMAAEHPLLGAAVELADTDGMLFTSRLSQTTHPWLADHAVQGTVLLPGTAFLELADPGRRPGRLRRRRGPHSRRRTAAHRTAGRARPGPRRRGRRGRASHRDRPLATRGRAAPVRGSCTRRACWPPAPRTAHDTTCWPPPADAQAHDLSGVYERFAEDGLTYGPAFQGLRQVWTHGDDVFAEIALPDDVAESAGAYGIHPALLDAALQSMAFVLPDGEGGLPFSFDGARLAATGASALRVRLTRTGTGTVAVRAVDQDGEPVLSVDALTVREAAALAPVRTAARTTACSGSSGRTPP